MKTIQELMIKLEEMHESRVSICPLHKDGNIQPQAKTDNVDFNPFYEIYVDFF